MMRPRRTDLLMLAGLLGFALIFILSATWLGQQDRVRYRLDPLPPLPPTEAALVRGLGLLTPRWPRALPWVAAGPSKRVESLASLAVRARAGDPLDILDEGVLRLLRKEYRLSVASARRGLEERPADGEFLLLLGLALEGAGDIEKAAAAYDRAAGVLGEDLDLLFRTGRLALTAGRGRVARTKAEAVVRLAPRQPEAQRLLAEACLATNDAGRAKRAFMDVLQLSPGDPEARRQVAILDGTPER